MALLKRVMLEGEDEFCASWSQARTVRAERVIVALGPDDASEESCRRTGGGKARERLADARFFARELVSTAYDYTPMWSLGERDYWAEAVLSSGEAEASASVPEGQHGVLWRHCWFDQLLSLQAEASSGGNDGHRDLDPPIMGDFTARLEACRRLASLEDQGRPPHPLLDPNQCPCQNDPFGNPCGRCHYHCPDRGVAAPSTPMNHAESSKTKIIGERSWWSEKTCWNCLGEKEQKAGSKLKECGGCKAAVYCSEECRNEHWPKHKEECATIKQHKKKTGDGDVPHCAACLTVTAAKLSRCAGCRSVQYCSKAYVRMCPFIRDVPPLSRSHSRSNDSSRSSLSQVPNDSLEEGRA